jgi:hypothetical protein
MNFSKSNGYKRFAHRSEEAHFSSGDLKHEAATFCNDREDIPKPFFLQSTLAVLRNKLRYGEPEGQHLGRIDIQ